MKLKGLIYDILIEEFQNKKLLNLMFMKWKAEEPQLTIDGVEKILEVFFLEKDRLSPKRPQVYSFLSRFDGQHGFEQFDPQNLKDIQKYSYTQIKSLYDEYQFDEENDIDEGNVFSRRSGASEERKTEESGKLWNSEQNVVFESGEFKVIYVKDQETAIKYGYFQKRLPSATQWCVTYDNRSNYWDRYRTEGRTFYFVKDGGRTSDDQYFIAALQTTKPEQNNGYPFKLTSLRNNGDNNLSKEELLRIYPQLTEYVDELDRVNYNRDNELIFDDKIARINEQTGSQFEFKRQDRKLKKQWIMGTNGANGGVITKKESWLSMDNDLRRLYITLLTPQTIDDKLQTYGILSLIDSQSDTRTLLREVIDEMKRNNPGLDKDFGIGRIYSKILKRDFDPQFNSKKNPNITIWKNRTEPNYGLYDSDNGTWVKHDGIVYSPEYSEIAHHLGYFRNEKVGEPQPQPEPETQPEPQDQIEPETADNGQNLQEQEGELKTYFVHVYSRDNSEDSPTNFYLIVDPSEDSGGGSIVVAKTWNSKFKPIFDTVENVDFEKEYKDINPELEKDINEKGGY